MIENERFYHMAIVRVPAPANSLLSSVKFDAGGP